MAKSGVEKDSERIGVGLWKFDALACDSKVLANDLSAIGAVRLLDLRGFQLRSMRPYSAGAVV
jgi:hypothetical protein